MTNISTHTRLLRSFRRDAALHPVPSLLVVLALLLMQPAELAFAADDDFFETRIRPLLVERCQGCHGEKKQWAGLRLDSADALQQGSENGPVVDTNSPDKSELIIRVMSDDDSVRMPPPEAGAALTADNVRDLRHWIGSGASWPETISLPTGSALADVERAFKEHWAFRPMVMPTVPALEDLDGKPQAINAFVLNKLEVAGLSFSPPADRRTLIRRATYDLTGLPPTSDEVTAFVADQSAEAYERLIDTLLASPRYGEKWGRIWLDIARYADTKGYVYAREERFFTHASMYRDWVIKAFNDDLPYDKFVLLQLAADCVSPEQTDALAAMGFLTLGRRFLGVKPDIMDDRIDVVSRGLLGLTVGCARCHDHKYDPIPTADYYSLYGVFSNSIEREVFVPPAMGSPAADNYVNGLREREQTYHDYFETQRSEAQTRFRNRIADYLMAQRELDKYPESTFSQIIAKAELIPGVVHRWAAFLERAAQTQDPVFATWIAFAKLKDDEFATKSPSVTQSLQQASPALHSRVLAAFNTPPTSAKDVADRYSKIFTAVDQAWTELRDQANKDGSPTPLELPNADDESLRKFLYQNDDSPCVIPRESMATTEWLWDTSTVEALWKKQGEIDRWVLQRPVGARHYVALVDQNTIYEPRIFRRGNPANKGKVVQRQFLSVIAGAEQQPFQLGSGRLEMARAIVEPSNPLTARVWVNRVWQNHFGRGLVETPSDFGMRSAPPSHPELLDWLALNFISNKWSTRWLHRTMMLSDAYQQASSEPPSSGLATDETTSAGFQSHANEIDPENRMLWRMNPRRLTFEEMRDTMIVYADEVDWGMGGKATDAFTPIAGGRYRRSIYGQIDRQYLPTVLNVFDFANPDMHSPQRNETTVPQQALFNLNHPFVAGRARAIAARIQEPASGNIGDRVRQLFELIYQRPPTPDQLASATEFIEFQPQAMTNNAPCLQRDWSYGYGSIDETNQRIKKFDKLPYSTSALWQGGAQLPDGTLGWVHVGAQKIHAGNDKDHSAIRRWTAPAAGTIRIRSNASHEHPQGDGVRGVLLSSRSGIVQSNVLFNSQARFDVEQLEVQAGDTIDFVVELHGTLSYEDLTWAPTITWTASSIGPEGADGSTNIEWDADRDFRTDDSGVLNPWEQLAQVLIFSNECMFLD